MNRRNQGFTIIELMLAMTFVALLLLAIAMTTMQIGNTYNKGVTLKSVNQEGRALSDDLTSTLASVPQFDVAKNVISQDNGGAGRLCLGNYTYVWNTGAEIASKPPANLPNTYSDDPSTIIRFVKLSDPGAALCGKNPPALNHKSMDGVELLTGGDHDLVIHKFTITQTAPAQGADAAGQALYAISMVIGTNDQTQLTSDNMSCRPPSQGSGNENYCAVNEFDMIARVGNKAGE